MDRIQAPDSSRIERLEQMVLCYEKDLLRISCVYLRDWKVAEDAVQDTFLKAYRHLDTFRNNSNEKTWFIQLSPPPAACWKATSPIFPQPRISYLPKASCPSSRRMCLNKP